MSFFYSFSMFCLFLLVCMFVLLKIYIDIAKKVEGLISVYLGKIDRRQGITRNPEVTVCNA